MPLPTFISYALEKRIARQAERFGKGAIEGVAGPEAANNAATGGSMIPLLTLGFAPNVVMAVVMFAFGVAGLLMKRFGFEAAPLVLAFVLGRMAEESIRQSLLMSSGRLSILLTRPIATAFIAAALIVLVLPLLLPPVKRMLRTVPPDDTT